MNDIVFMMLCLIPLLLLCTGGSILDFISNAIKSIWKFLSTSIKSLIRDEDHEREVKEMERFLYNSIKNDSIVKSQPIKEDSEPSFSKFDIN